MCLRILRNCEKLIQTNVLFIYGTIFSLRFVFTFRTCRNLQSLSRVWNVLFLSDVQPTICRVITDVILIGDRNKCYTRELAKVISLISYVNTHFTVYLYIKFRMLNNVHKHIIKSHTRNRAD